MTEADAFRRIAIVNRGEPAVRLLRAVRELNVGRTEPYRTIALYTEPDAGAKFVREADETYCIGEALYVDPDGLRKSTYLDYDRLRRALTETRAEAAWVGWGLVAEHAAFADMCDELGVAFIGPSGDTMRKLGDKIASKHLAEEAGVPVAPWSKGPVGSVEEAREQAERIGYPLMVKATAGGGGRGIRKVRSADELEEAFESARREAYAGFGDDTVFLERMLAGARHIEVQIIGDGKGTTWGLGVRDCTVQRRNQKVFEEAPSPALTEAQDAEIRDAAARLGTAAGYRNAGTVEFLYDPETKTFSFMEVNARLQVEHPVTELATGADLVKLQIHVASGGSLGALTMPPHRGHAIEARITAEAPERDFAPAPGRISRLRLPAGPGVRVDAGVDEGDEVAPQFDSMIAKVITFGKDREEALGRLHRALFEMELLVEGGASNKGFLLGMLEREEMRTSDIHIGWLDALAAKREHVTSRGASVAVVEAAIQAYLVEEDLDQRRFFVSASRGRPEPSESLGRKLELSHEGIPYEVGVRRLDANRYSVDLEGHVIAVRREALGDAMIRIGCGDRTYQALSMSKGVERVVEIDGIPHRVASEGGGTIRASAPGVVVRLAVEVGQEVQADAPLVVLEAMKTEMTLVAPFAGKVRKVLVEPNVQVGAGAALLQLEESEDEGATPQAGERLAFEDLACAPAEPETQRHLTTLESVILGFDGDVAGLAKVLAEHGTLTPGVAPGDAAVFDRELAILEKFVDIMSLFRRAPSEDTGELEIAESEAEYLHLYLRDLSSKAEALPESFRRRLGRALAHFGIDGLEPTDALREALFRILKSRVQARVQGGPIQGILQRWIDHHGDLEVRMDERGRGLLDRLVATTQGRFQAVSDLALEARYRYFERPLLEATRVSRYEAVRAVIEELAEGAEPAPRIDELVKTPLPLKAFLGTFVPDASSALKGIMAEAVARRYYRRHDLRSGTRSTVGDAALFTSLFEADGAERALLLALVERDALLAAPGALAEAAKDAAKKGQATLELHTWEGGAEPSGEAIASTARGLLEAIEGADLPTAVDRVVVGIGRLPNGGAARGSGAQFTFDRGEDGAFAEVTTLRGLHPMMAERLQLWRLSTHFDITRIPTVEDLYLFHLVARENPRDERLYALAEVRDMTAVRDAQGRAVMLPTLERQLLEALASIRVFQAGRSARDRLQWNRVRLFVRPPIDLDAEDLQRLSRRLGPSTRGHGLERVEVSGLFPDGEGFAERRLEIAPDGESGLLIRSAPPPTEPLMPLSAYHQNVVRLRKRGLTYPYALIETLTAKEGPYPPGEFQELDLDETGEKLVPVDRPPGNNTANMVVGRLTHRTAKNPQGMTRVVLLGDASRSMGSLAEAECRIILAALDMAEAEEIPLEWVAVSAGARIAMDTGTENMDWISYVLRRLIEFTQAGHEVNIIVAGINVGAQPYWNAEATMLMHTRGVLIQTAQGSMVLTGKRALDYSGGVSAEDDFGIGGFDRVMGPNGQAQYFAKDLQEAYHILFRHYDHTYRVPGERFPRRAETSDPLDRDIRPFPHEAEGFATIGEVFSEEHNPGRKRPFDIRRVMRAVSDQDHEPLARWSHMRDAESAVVWDAHVGGYPVCMLGLESRPLPRRGFIPADGPEKWTGGTLFPLSSKKVARAINAASGNRPLVVLANLSGFDGSPESMRSLQLEFGAEIGRAVVNFDGPIAFTVVSRYHGGAFVVFSARLNDNMEVAALEGTHASVIGGAPAAGVVFAREVSKRTDADPRIVEQKAALKNATGAERVRLQAAYASLWRHVHSEKLGEKAREFDTVHSVERARDVGSVHEILPAERLRPYVIEALERGMAKVRAAE